MADEHAGRSNWFRWRHRATSRARRTQPPTVSTGAAPCAHGWSSAPCSARPGPSPSRHGCCICRSSSTATCHRAPRGSGRIHHRAPARRGEIFDRNGNLLAYTVDADSIFADPGRD